MGWIMGVTTSQDVAQAAGALTSLGVRSADGAMGLGSSLLGVHAAMSNINRQFGDGVGLGLVKESVAQLTEMGVPSGFIQSVFALNPAQIFASDPAIDPTALPLWGLPNSGQGHSLA